MNLPLLHTGLTKLLEASGVKILYPDFVFFAAYNPGAQDVLSSGIEQLVKFRLLYPETPVLFFSILHLNQLLPKDPFGVLQLALTEFIQLPCSKEAIQDAAAKYRGTAFSIKDAAWKSFSESACKALLKQRMLELMHGHRFPIGNKALNPLRMNCLTLASLPQLKEDFLPLLNRNFEVLREFMAIPEITELLHWCSICCDAEDAYLQQAFSFSTNLEKLSCCSSNTNQEKLISLVDQINASFEKLVLLNGKPQTECFIY